MYVFCADKVCVYTYMCSVQIRYVFVYFFTGKIFMCQSFNVLYRCDTCLCACSLYVFCVHVVC